MCDNINSAVCIIQQLNHTVQIPITNDVAPTDEQPSAAIGFCNLIFILLYTCFILICITLNFFFSPVLENKNVRGRTTGKKADQVCSQLGVKIPITILKDVGRPTGAYAEMFSSEIGIVIRNHAPLNVEKWKNVTQEVKQKLVKRLNVSPFCLNLLVAPGYKTMSLSKTNDVLYINLFHVVLEVARINF